VVEACVGYEENCNIDAKQNDVGVKIRFSVRLG
jgi:hypothetical protein